MTASRTERTGLHWSTWLIAAAMLVPGVYCQLNGRVYRTHEGLYYGWPFAHPDDGFRLLSNAFALDVLCTILLCASTGFVAERAMHRLRGGPQVGLRTLLMLTALVAALLALFRLQAIGMYTPPVEIVDRNVVMDLLAVRHPPLVTLTILAGLGCTLYSLSHLAMWCFRRGLCLRRGWRGRKAPMAGDATTATTLVP